MRPSELIDDLVANLTVNDSSGTVYYYENITGDGTNETINHRINFTPSLPACSFFDVWFEVELPDGLGLLNKTVQTTGCPPPNPEFSNWFIIGAIAVFAIVGIVYVSKKNNN